MWDASNSDAEYSMILLQLLKLEVLRHTLLIWDVQIPNRITGNVREKGQKNAANP